MILAALLLALPAAPVVPDEAPDRTTTAVFQAVEDRWNARDVEGYLALWRFDTPEAAQAEREFAERLLGADARLDVQAPEAADVPLGTRRVGAYAELVIVEEPWGRVEQLLFRVERREDGWRVYARLVVGEVSGLSHLSLDPHGRRVDGHVLRLPDFELEMRTGTLFTSPAALGPTVLVFAGRGRVRFKPRPAAEREQLRRYIDHPELDRDVTRAFVRLAPSDFDRLVSGPPLQPDPAAAERWSAARRFYTQHVESAYVLDSTIAGSPWWTAPTPGDTLVVFDHHTGPLTLSISASSPEGVMFFDRPRRRRICMYPQAGRPRDFDEDEGRATDVLHQDLRLRIDPHTGRLEGQARLRIGLKTPSSSLRLRLNEALTVESITSEEGRRHLFFRVRHQDQLTVALSPFVVAPEITLTVRYRGHLPAPPFELEVTRPQDPPPPPPSEVDHLRLGDPVHAYLAPALWYPQPETDDYATATLEVELPAGWTAVGPGRRSVTPLGAGTTTRYDADRPVKHVVFAVGRLVEAGRLEAAGVHVTAYCTARLRGEARDTLDMAGRILRVLVEHFGPAPYENLQLILVEGAKTAGHGPPGLVFLSRPSLAARASYDDPANFVEVPGYIFAHELAHQWWGDAVTGRSYHEAWISEATAQYAAALWVQASRGDGEFERMLVDMAEWAIRKNEAGPISLGTRIGHVDGDGKLFRAVVYDKGAWVLHMLRRLIGEGPFRAGLIAFQARHRFSKVSTAELREALETAGGMALAPYFETWIYSTELPVLSMTQRRDAVPEGVRTTVTVKARNLPGPVPLAVTLRHADGVMTHLERLTMEGGRWEYVTPSAPRKVEINDDLGLLARRDD